MTDPEIYKTSHMRLYEEPDEKGYTTIRVLDFLKGKKWDKVALGYVHALRPSSIRVVNNEMTCDARPWRVTVLVTLFNKIEWIEQEVEVGLPEGVEHGEALGHALQYGLNSKQVKWHQNATGYSYMFGKYYKTVTNLDGETESVEFPK